MALLDFFRSVPERLSKAGARLAAQDGRDYEAESAAAKEEEERQRRLAEAQEAFAAERQRLDEASTRQSSMLEQARERFDQLKAAPAAAGEAIGQGFSDLGTAVQGKAQDYGDWRGQIQAEDHKPFEPVTSPESPVNRAASAFGEAASQADKEEPGPGGLTGVGKNPFGPLDLEGAQRRADFEAEVGSTPEAELGETAERITRPVRSALDRSGASRFAGGVKRGVEGIGEIPEEIARGDYGSAALHAVEGPISVAGAMYNVGPSVMAETGKQLGLPEPAAEAIGVAQGLLGPGGAMQTAREAVSRARSYREAARGLAPEDVGVLAEGAQRLGSRMVEGGPLRGAFGLARNALVGPAALVGMGLGGKQAEEEIAARREAGQDEGAGAEALRRVTGVLGGIDTAVGALDLSGGLGARAIGSGASGAPRQTPEQRQRGDVRTTVERAVEQAGRAQGDVPRLRTGEAPLYGETPERTPEWTERRFEEAGEETVDLATGEIIPAGERPLEEILGLRGERPEGEAAETLDRAEQPARPRKEIERDLGMAAGAAKRLGVDVRTGAGADASPEATTAYENFRRFQAEREGLEAGRAERAAQATANLDAEGRDVRTGLFPGQTGQPLADVPAPPAGLPYGGRGGYNAGAYESNRGMGELNSLVGELEATPDAPFFSRLQGAVDRLPDANDPAQTLRELEASSEVANEELTWTGLGDLLTRRASEGATVTRRELQQWLANNRIVVAEKPRGLQEADPGATERRQALEAETASTYETYLAAVDGANQRAFELVSPYQRDVSRAFNAQQLDRDRWSFAHAPPPQAAVDYVTGATGTANQYAFELYRNLLPDNARDELDDLQAVVDIRRLRWQTLRDQMVEARRAENRTEQGLKGGKPRWAGPASTYQNYALPGHSEPGADYREFVIMLAPRTGPGGMPNQRYGTHWDESNVIGFLRTSTRYTVDGKKTLVVEEFQSDWHQKGRKAGYAGRRDPQAVATDPAYAEFKRLQQAVREADAALEAYPPEHSLDAERAYDAAITELSEDAARLLAERFGFDASRLEDVVAVVRNDGQVVEVRKADDYLPHAGDAQTDPRAKQRIARETALFDGEGRVRELDAQELSDRANQAQAFADAIQANINAGMGYDNARIKARRDGHRSPDDQRVWYWAEPIRRTLNRMADADPEAKRLKGEMDWVRQNWRHGRDVLATARNTARDEVEFAEGRTPEVALLAMREQHEELYARQRAWLEGEVRALMEEGQAQGWLATTTGEGGRELDPGLFLDPDLHAGFLLHPDGPVPDLKSAEFGNPMGPYAGDSPQQAWLRRSGWAMVQNLENDRVLQGLENQIQRVDRDLLRDMISGGKQPGGPFQETWQPLLAKRLLQIATAGDWEGLGWTRGEVHADRYDPAQLLQTVTYERHRDPTVGGRMHLVFENGGDRYVDLPTEKGDPATQMAEYIGDEPARRLVEREAAEWDAWRGPLPGRTQPLGRMETDELGQLYVDGKSAKGLKKFYNVTLPDILGKLGARAGMRYEGLVPILQFKDKPPDEVINRPTEGGRENPVPNAEPVHYMTVTPQAKEALARQPLLFEGQEGTAPPGVRDEPPADVGDEPALDEGLAGELGLDGGALAMRPPSVPPLGPGETDALLGAAGALAGSGAEAAEIAEEERQGREVGLGEKALRIGGMGLAGGAALGSARRLARRGPAGLVDVDTGRGPGSAAAERLEPRGLGGPQTTEFRRGAGRWSTEPGTDLYGRQPVADEATATKAPGSGARPFTEGARQQTAGPGGEAVPYTAYATGSIGRELGDAFSAARARVARANPGAGPDERAVLLAQDKALQRVVDAVIGRLDTPELRKAVLADQVYKTEKQNKTLKTPKPMPTGPFPVFNPATGQPFALVDVLRQYQDGVNAGGLEWYEQVASPLIELATVNGRVDGQILEELLHSWTVGGHQLDPTSNMQVALASVRIRSDFQKAGVLQGLVDAYRAGDAGEPKSDPPMPRGTRPKPTAAQTAAATAAVKQVAKALGDQTRAVVTPPYGGAPIMSQHAKFLLDYWAYGATDVPGGTKLANYYSNASDALRAAVNWLSVPDRWEFRRLGASKEASALMALGDPGRQMSQIAMALNEELARALGVAPHQFQAAAWTGYNRWGISGKGAEEPSLGQIDEVLRRTRNERADFVTQAGAGGITPLTAGVSAARGPGGGPGAVRTVEQGFQHQPRLPEGVPAGEKTRSSAESREAMREAIRLQGRAVATSSAAPRSARLVDRLLEKAGLERPGTRLGGAPAAKTPGTPADAWQVPALREAGIPNHLDVRDDASTGEVWLSGHLPQEHEATASALAALMARAVGADSAYVVRPLFGKDARGPDNALVVSHDDLTRLGKTAADLPPHVRGPNGDYYAVVDFDGTAGGAKGLEPALVKLGFDPHPKTGNLLGATFDVKRLAVPDDAAADALIAGAGASRRPVLDRVRDGLRGTPAPLRPGQQPAAGAPAVAGLLTGEGARGRGYGYGEGSGRRLALPGLDTATGRVPPGKGLHEALRGPLTDGDLAKPARSGGAPAARADDADGEDLGDEADALSRGGYTPESVRRANRSSRSGAGAIGKDPVAYRALRDTLSPEEAGRVLDFGAGKSATHTLALRALGYDVTAHDFGENLAQGLHDPAALDSQYDTVVAANVLNVQETPQMLDDTLADLAGAVGPGGRVIFNYPAGDVRYMGLPASEMEARLLDHFSTVERIGGTPAVPIWRAEGPRVEGDQAERGPLYARKKLLPVSTKKANASADRAYAAAIATGAKGGQTIADMAGHDPEILRQLTTGPNANRRVRFMETVADVFEVIKQSMADALEQGTLSPEDPAFQGRLLAGQTEATAIRLTEFAGELLSGDRAAGVNSHRQNRPDQVRTDVHAIMGMIVHNERVRLEAAGDRSGMVGVADIAVGFTNRLYANLVHETVHAHVSGHGPLFEAYMKAYTDALDKSGVGSQMRLRLGEHVMEGNHDVVRAIHEENALLESDPYAGPWEPGGLSGADARKWRRERPAPPASSNEFWNDPFRGLLGERSRTGLRPDLTEPGRAGRPAADAGGLPGGRGRPPGPLGRGDPGDPDAGRGARGGPAGDVRAGAAGAGAGDGGAAGLRGGRPDFDGLGGERDLADLLGLGGDRGDVESRLGIAYSAGGSGAGSGAGAAAGAAGNAGGSGAGAAGGSGASGAGAPGAAGAGQPPSWNTTLQNLLKLAVLFTPKGWARQGIGNALGLLWAPYERSLAGRGAQVFDRGGTAADRPVTGEGWAMLGAWLDHRGEAWQEAKDSFMGRSGAAQAANAAAMGINATTNPGTGLKGVINRATERGYGIIGMFDVLAKRLAQEGEARALGHREDVYAGGSGANATRNVERAQQALTQAMAGGLDLKDALASLSDADRRIVTGALRSGDYRTLTQELDAFGQWVEDGRNLPGGVGKYVVPFWKVPYNGMRYDLERSPLGLISAVKGSTGDVSRHRQGGATEMYERWVRALTGTAMSTALLKAVLDGYATGPEPADTAEKDAWRAEGKTPYSLLIGGRWVPMAMFPGINATLVQMGNIGDFVRRRHVSQEPWDADAYYRLANRAVTGTISAIATRPFFDQFANVLENLGESDEAGERGLGGVATDVASGFAVPGLVRDIERATDDVDRAPRHLGERVLANIPGLSGQVPARRDVYGNVKRRTGAGWERVVNPLLGRQATPELAERRFVGATGGEEDTAIAEAKKVIEAFKRDPWTAREPTAREYDLATYTEDAYVRKMRSEERARLKAERSEGQAPLTALLPRGGRGGGGIPVANLVAR